MNHAGLAVALMIAVVVGFQLLKKVVWGSVLVVVALALGAAVVYVVLTPSMNVGG